MWFLETFLSFKDDKPEAKLKQKISESDSLEKSKDFLNKKLEKLSKNELTYKEQKLLENQIQEHEELKKLYDDYLEEKELLWKQTRDSLDALFENYSQSVIWDNNFEDIKANLENGKEKFNFFRNKVKENIDIKWEFEDIYERESIKKFIDIFTLEYISFLDKNYENSYSFFKKNSFKLLLLNKKQLNLILEKILRNFIDEKINFDKKIKFNIVDKIETVDFNKLKEWFLIKKKEIERKKQEKIQRKKKCNIGISIIEWNLTKAQIDEIRSILNTDIEDIEKLKIMYINEVLIKEWFLTKDQLLLLLENKTDNFNYLDYLHNFKLTWEIEKVALDLIESKWIKINYKNKNQILENFRIFLMFFISIESDGYNVKNKKSSAEWYYQFLWKNGDWWDGFSSFETWLRRTSLYYTGSHEIREWDSNPEWVQNAYLKSWKEFNFSPSKLSAQEQTILFLCDIFNRDSSSVKTHLVNILINWNKQSIKQLYKEVHHTNVVWNTNKRLEKHMKEFFAKYWNLKKVN